MLLGAFKGNVYYGLVDGTYKDLPLNNSEKISDKDHAETGGIDLKKSSMPLKTRNQGGPLKFNIDPVMLRDLDSAPGLTGQILEISPLQSLPGFLGMSKDEEAQQKVS